MVMYFAPLHLDKKMCGLKKRQADRKTNHRLNSQSYSLNRIYAIGDNSLHKISSVGVKLT